MKKLILVSLLLFIPKVQALTYTEYSDFSEPSDEKVTSNELIDVKEEKRYRYYKLNKILGPYSKENSDFSFVDYDDYILGEESERSLDKPNEDDRVINLNYGYQYKRVSQVNYIKIKNLGSDVLNIKNLKIYDGNNQIKVYDTREYLTINYNMFTGTGGIKSNGYLKIEFHEEHYLDNLRIEIILNGENINYYYETGNNSIYSTDYMNYDETMDFNHIFEFKNSTLVNPTYEYFYDLTRETSNVLMINSDLLTFYSYQDKLYRHYNLEKIYNDEYTVNSVGDFIYRDEEDYKIYYSYRTRNIIEDDIGKNMNNVITFEKMNNVVKVPSTFKNDNNTKNISKNNILCLFYFIIFLSLSIIILLLSKHYKSYIKCAKV